MTQRHTPRAFTLVELLVVIGIIAVLISIILPTLIGARQQAMTVQCLSNLRQLGMGFQMYIQENKLTYPQPTEDGSFAPSSGAPNPVGNAAFWFNALDPYLMRNMKDTSADATKLRNYTMLKQDPIYATFGEDTATTGGVNSKTLKMNTWFGDVDNLLPGGIYWTRTSKIRESARTVLMFDGVAQDCAKVLPADLGKSSISGQAYGDEESVGLRHTKKKGANVLFVDGHAAEIFQPIFPYSSSSKKTIYDTWYFEYLGHPTDTEANRAAATAEKRTEQQLIWNFRHP